MPNDAKGETNLHRTRCFLGLGGNIGNVNATFNQVIQHFSKHPNVSWMQESPRYRSAPVDAAGPDFINSVLALDWHQGPIELLKFCQKLEAQFGRTREHHNAPRTMDIDVLLFGAQVLNNPELTVPHPRMHERLFVLLPLCDLAPLLEIPGIGPLQDRIVGINKQACERIGG